MLLKIIKVFVYVAQKLFLLSLFQLLFVARISSVILDLRFFTYTYKYVAQCCGSGFGIGCFFTPPDPGSGSGIRDGAMVGSGSGIRDK
jgi:hypothetical protein